MDPFTSAIASGIVWEVLKKGATVTVSYLKNALRSWLLKDSEIEALANIANQMPNEYKLNAKLIEGYLDTNSTFSEIVARVNNSDHNTIIQTHSGSGDNVGRDKIVKG